MNIVIIDKSNQQPIVRYEIHLAGDNDRPPEREYFDRAWRRAVTERLVDADARDAYDFQMQPPKNLYESSS